MRSGSEFLWGAVILAAACGTPEAGGPEEPEVQLSVGSGPAMPGRSVVVRMGDIGVIWVTADPSSGLTALDGVIDPGVFCSSVGVEGYQITPLQFLFQSNGGAHLLAQVAVHHALVYRAVSLDICGELAGLEPIAEGDVRFRYHDNDAAGTSPGGNAFGAVAIGTVTDLENGGDARLTVRNLLQVLPGGDFRQVVGTVELGR